VNEQELKARIAEFERALADVETAFQDLLALVERKSKGKAK
jgi:hypothetical protein